MQYFIKRNDKVNGPFTDAQIKSGISAGKLKDTDMISESKDGPWKPFRQATKQEDDLATSKTQEPVSEIDEQVSTSSSPPLKSDQTKDCPYCAEPIAAAAIKCKHCGEMLNSNTVNAQLQEPEPHKKSRQGIGQTSKELVVSLFGLKRPKGDKLRKKHIAARVAAVLFALLVIALPTMYFVDSARDAARREELRSKAPALYDEYEALVKERIKLIMDIERFDLALEEIDIQMNAYSDMPAADQLDRRLVLLEGAHSKRDYAEKTLKDSDWDINFSRVESALFAACSPFRSGWRPARRNRYEARFGRYQDVPLNGVSGPTLGDVATTILDNLRHAKKERWIKKGYMKGTWINAYHIPESYEDLLDWKYGVAGSEYEVFLYAGDK